MRPRSCELAVALAAFAQSGCGSDLTLARSSVPRETSPQVTEAERRALIDGNTAFALELLRTVRSPVPAQNAFLSPHSVSQALAMAYAGARANTAVEMARALRFDLPPERFHVAFDWLDLQLTSRVQTAAAPSIRLRSANALFAHKATSFRRPFLDLLQASYGAGVNQVDFVGDPEGSRGAINRWVSDQTEGKIKDLLPGGSVTRDTRIVLSNAIYFKADWRDTFLSAFTRPDTFHRLDGSAVSVEMMQRESTYAYIETSDFQALDLPYQGGQIAMLVLLPRAGGFPFFEESLTQERLAAIVAALRATPGRLDLPRFRYESAAFSLKQALHALGMRGAFDSQTADFSGMADSERLSLSDVLHKGFISVDENGTEAAAATAAVGAAASSAIFPETFVMRVDRPFLFAIRDVPTGALLFLGRIVDPRG
jgi:serpin B